MSAYTVYNTCITCSYKHFVPLKLSQNISCHFIVFISCVLLGSPEVPRPAAHTELPIPQNWGTSLGQRGNLWPPMLPWSGSWSPLRGWPCHVVELCPVLSWQLVQSAVPWSVLDDVLPGSQRRLCRGDHRGKDKQACRFHRESGMAATEVCSRNSRTVPCGWRRYGQGGNWTHRSCWAWLEFLSPS